MARIFIGFMICFLFLNCDKKENAPYLISIEKIKLLNELKKKNIPPPPPGFYSYNNIIIDQKGNFYFYQRESTPWHCIPSEKDTIPDFFDIKPIEITKIPNNTITDFIKQNVTSKNEMKRILIIASQNDTIKDKTLISYLNENELRAFCIRRTTQEEDTVLKYKKNNEYYSYKNIKWDQNRIILPFYKTEAK
ncbi:MAG: hypothetical protein REI96_03175 [Flavobacterium nitrogenifigens]|uniref:Uncharacterized protein n=1 Tax=Flavobacterium nitrogenifigens TaxID=1617283 RepID=A0A521CC70_9FLAO|nr:hypothetical protein [Flavobacterium nitrogenifigens]KAF2327059.1 hypothetical protein DM397_20780 [Flavobacterium nitrogenifigens]MDQ8011427.1 hypothetical protein [Flavobacterium nitrogenifigens]SMO57008.1 hypothetical protein SAMN06265220_102203 [Flavobacterium nitrogenifigens]